MSEGKVNRQYKDRLFSFIFGSEENKSYLMDLYNALNGTNYTDLNMLEITTIQDVVYMGMKNDVSCMIDSELDLFEHQSTYNPNMPFRQFQYYAKLSDAWVTRNQCDIYSTSLVKIPAPKCYVFYNGTKERADRELLHLSDAFMKPSEGYEWTVTMLNINKGHNQILMERCRALMEYAEIVDQIRSNCNTMDIENAVDAAIKAVISRNGLLAEFLERHRAEVKNMCITEYNEELHLRNTRLEGRLEGLAEGRLEMLEKMIRRNYMDDELMELGFSMEQICEAKKKLLQTI